MKEIERKFLVGLPAEVEFPDERSAGMWKPYEWMVKEVTEDTRYKMRCMCQQ